MNADHMNDQQLLDNVITALREVRARAPRDFLLLLSILLVILLAVVALLTVLLQDEFLKNLLLNVGIEIVGAWLTVILIDGLWHRLQVGSLAEYEVMAQKLESRKATPLTDEEREAWSIFIELYRDLEAEMQTMNPFRQVRAMYVAWNKRRWLEAQGNQVLTNFEKQVKAQIAEDHDSMATSESEREELVALRNEVVELRKTLERYVSSQTPSR
jgi:hypothetical protein